MKSGRRVNSAVGPPGESLRARLMNFKTRLFAILWIAGTVGVLSFLLVDLAALLANLPGAAGAGLPFPPFVLKLLSTIQTTVILSIAVLLGVALAHRGGFLS